MEAAAATRVPAGAALAVDRQLFAEYITRRIEAHPYIQLVREEVTEIPADAITIIATGPVVVGCFDGRDHETHRERSALFL